MNVLLVGSGRNAVQIKEQLPPNTKLVTVNNAFRLRPDWDFAVFASDFPKSKRPVSTPSQQVVANYTEACEELGIRPNTMFFAAVWWTLVRLKPKRLAIIGFDMDYTPDNDGNTHFYGIGDDIKARGIPDPMRMVKVHLKGDMQGLYDLFTDLSKYCERNGIDVVNISDNPKSLQPFRKVAYKDVIDETCWC